MKRFIIGCILDHIDPAYAGDISGPLPSDGWQVLPNLIASATARPYNLNDYASTPGKFTLNNPAGAYFWAAYKYSNYIRATHIALIHDDGIRIQECKIYSPRSSEAEIETGWTNQILLRNRRMATIYHFNGSGSLEFLGVAARASLTAGGVAQMAEFMPIYAVKMPVLQELASYRERVINGATAEYKTLDGAVRKVTTAPETMEIECNFTWSDDGQTKAELEKIYTYAAGRAAPLVVGLIDDAAHGNNEKFEIITTTDAPEITQPEPGIYTTSIGGRAQP